MTETGSIAGTAGFALSFNGTGTVNTSGGGTTTAMPTIASVTDGASYTPNVAQGSFFTVWGTNLAPSSTGLTNRLFSQGAEDARSQANRSGAMAPFCESRKIMVS